jgi:hypothetical protein
MQQTMLLWPVCALASLLALAACGRDVEDVSKDVCASGKRWAGEIVGNEEMFPGRDCVGCHRDLDGPEFLAAGTVYGLIDETGERTTAHDCFGVEGARVTITAGDGEVLQTHTNRAGNFYFEGRASSLVKPLSVVVDYTFPDGSVSREPMSTHPSYGGCARCHNPQESNPTTDAGGRVLGPDEVVFGVYPIYTGPVHQ